MTLGNAVWTINKRAKLCEFARSKLKRWLECGSFGELSKKETEVMDFIVMKYGLMLTHSPAENESANFYVCDLEMDPLNCIEYAPLDQSCSPYTPFDCAGCKHKESIIMKFVELDKEKLCYAIELLGAEIDSLYNLKAKVCGHDCFQTLLFQEIPAGSGRLFKLVDIEGYKPHVPVNAEERKAISTGRAAVEQVGMAKRRKPIVFIDDVELSKAIRFCFGFVLEEENERAN